jgi:hypothetical protein
MAVCWCCRVVGALGVFEFGAARALFEQKIRPDLIAGGRKKRNHLEC